MFRCQNCGINVQSGQPVNRVVAEKRNKTYEVIKKRGKYRNEPYTVHGWEISKEIRVCPHCFEQLTGLQPRLVIPVEPKKTERQERRRSFRDNRNNKRNRVEHPNSKKPLVVQKLNNVRKPKSPV